MVEQYWEDITVYYVEFTASDTDKVLRNFHKTLVFRSDVEACEVPQFVKSRFLNIVDVTAVDELSEGLMLKAFIEKN